MITRVVSARRLRFSVFQDAVFVLLPNESFHCRIGLVGVNGDGGLDAFGVVFFVDGIVAFSSHILRARVSI